MIITCITNEITRCKALTDGNQDAETVVYIDDSTFREMRRETSQQAELNDDEYEIILHGTLRGCRVHHVYGNTHGWRVCTV